MIPIIHSVQYIFAIFERGELHRNDLGHTIKPCHWSRWREDPTMILPKVAARISMASWTFCTILIIHSVQYIFAIFGRGELHRNDLGHTIKPCHWSRPFTSFGYWPELILPKVAARISMASWAFCMIPIMHSVQ